MIVIGTICGLILMAIGIIGITNIGQKELAEKDKRLNEKLDKILKQLEEK